MRMTREAVQQSKNCGCGEVCLAWQTFSFFRTASWLVCHVSRELVSTLLPHKEIQHHLGWDGQLGIIQSRKLLLNLIYSLLQDVPPLPLYSGV